MDKKYFIELKLNNSLSDKEQKVWDEQWKFASLIKEDNFIYSNEVEPKRWLYGFVVGLEEDCPTILKKIDVCKIHTPYEIDNIKVEWKEEGLI
ncbi:MAG: hypothetical protein LBL60_01325 [Mycoplasmataceae bacterium]|jgi:hypothetical protein|nr:hypothetical protein [Mycoplasmataceae bacterium]